MEAGLPVDLDDSVDGHTTPNPGIMSALLRPSFRSLSTSARALQRIPAVAPADVVAGKAAGPPIVRDTSEQVVVATVSDAPSELQHRQVRIFKPTKNTMQSAKGKTRVWRIDWDVLQGSGRWTNPLMGWQSSADYMQGTTLAFRTREDAVRFVSRAISKEGRAEDREEWRAEKGEECTEGEDGGRRTDALERRGRGWRDDGDKEDRRTGQRQSTVSQMEGSEPGMLGGLWRACPAARGMCHRMSIRRPVEATRPSVSPCLTSLPSVVLHHNLCYWCDGVGAARCITVWHCASSS